MAMRGRAKLALVLVIVTAACLSSGCAFVKREKTQEKLVNGKLVQEKYTQNFRMIFPFFIQDVKVYADRRTEGLNILLLGGKYESIVLVDHAKKYPWAVREDGKDYLTKVRYVLPFYYVSDKYTSGRWDKVRSYGIVYTVSESQPRANP